MNKQIELLRNKLEMLIAEKNSLVDNEVVSVSQELDKLIIKYHMCESSNVNKSQTVYCDFSRMRTVKDIKAPDMNFLEFNAVKFI